MAGDRTMYRNVTVTVQQWTTEPVATRVWDERSMR